MGVYVVMAGMWQSQGCLTKRMIGVLEDVKMKGNFGA